MLRPLDLDFVSVALPQNTHFYSFAKIFTIFLYIIIIKNIKYIVPFLHEINLNPCTVI
jgi:hypothetical protein